MALGTLYSDFCSWRVVIVWWANQGDDRAHRLAQVAFGLAAVSVSCILILSWLHPSLHLYLCHYYPLDKYINLIDSIFYSVLRHLYPDTPVSSPPLPRCRYFLCLPCPLSMLIISYYFYFNIHFISLSCISVYPFASVPFLENRLLDYRVLVQSTHCWHQRSGSDKWDSHSLHQRQPFPNLSILYRVCRIMNSNHE